MLRRSKKGHGTCEPFALRFFRQIQSLRHQREALMDLQLTNKKALVTGSTAGIGFAIASLLAQEGASVIVSGRSPGRVEETVRRIQREKLDAPVTGVAADLGTKEGVDLLTGKVPALDVLVNNL